jgi:hypothetical protein
VTLFNKLFPAKVIPGCRDPRPLMTRWRILTTPWFAIKLHHFHRSDEDRELHDHPWLFVSLILRGGYNEVRPSKWMRERLHLCYDARRYYSLFPYPKAVDRHLERRRYGPGALLIRPAWWAHRVELLDLEHGSWSLVIVFPKVREWGFFTQRGWLPWHLLHLEAGCADDIRGYRAATEEGK